jgi:hypothetical protein
MTLEATGQSFFKSVSAEPQRAAVLSHSAHKLIGGTAGPRLDLGGGRDLGTDLSKHLKAAIVQSIAKVSARLRHRGDRLREFQSLAA